MDDPHLIEVAFPQKQTWLDAVQEKNVRHGHLSILRVRPAPRPRAAHRSTVLPKRPGTGTLAMNRHVTSSPVESSTGQGDLFRQTPAR